MRLNDLRWECGMAPCSPWACKKIEQGAKMSQKNAWEKQKNGVAIIQVEIAVQSSVFFSDHATKSRGLQ